MNAHRPVDAPPRRRFGPIGDAFEKLFLWPPFVAATTIFGVLAALLGAIWEHAISESANFAIASLAVRIGEFGIGFAKTALLKVAGLFTDGHGFELQAVLFLAVAGLFGVCFGGTLWGQARGADRATQELKNATAKVLSETSQIGEQTRSLGASSDYIAKLVARLQTLPPAGFLPKYQEAIPVLFAPWLFSLPTWSQADLERIVRTQLKTVLTLASAFDAKGETLRYGANLMLFHRVAGMSDAEYTRLGALLRFTEASVDLRNLLGALELVPLLSACTGAHGFEYPDASCDKAFALPVPPRAADGAVPSNLLPGAPAAAMKGLPGFFRGAEDLKIFADNRNFTDDLRKRWIQSFDENGRAIVSFMSFPVFDWTTRDRYPVAVLNIHRDQDEPDVGDKAGLLWPMMTPVLGALGALVRSYLATMASGTLASTPGDQT